MTITAGEAMNPEGTSGEVVDVWMHTRLAEKMVMNVGDELEIGVNVQAATTPIRVAGIWQATDPTSSYWFENPDATLQNVLLIRRNDYVSRIQPSVASGSWYAAWHIILNGDEVYPELAQDCLQDSHGPRLSSTAICPRQGSTRPLSIRSSPSSPGVTR